MNSKGIGLGLVIARKIAKQFEGEITCKSKAGFGSNFTFKFRIFDKPDDNQGQID